MTTKPELGMYDTKVSVKYLRHLWTVWSCRGQEGVSTDKVFYNDLLIEMKSSTKNFHIFKN